MAGVILFNRRIVMVFYFTSTDGFVLYMGKDKYENENLIAYGWPEDVWFHVDDLSSAHVYLRMRPGMTIDQIPARAIDECCQLVKGNSIEGCKLATVNVVYTPWENLRKGADMDVGQVGFKDQRQVRKIRVAKNRDILKVLGRSKQEREPNLQEEKRIRDEAELAAKRDERKAKREADRLMEEARRKERETRSYSSLFEKLHDPEYREEAEAEKVATKDVSAAVAYEEDFM